MTESILLTREERITMAEQALAEGRIIQGSWRKPPKGPGRELVCALAAFGPDINGSGDCPADLMPEWLAALVPAIDDGIAVAEVPWFAGRLIERAKRWHVLDNTAWERIRTGFMIAAIRQAITSAKPVQPDPEPSYWTKVVAATDQVISALESGQGIQEARAAAGAAADAAARAADAAYAAARAADAAADAAYAAYAAARAADAAARAAADAAYAAYAAARAADAAARAADAAARAADAAARAADAAARAAWKSTAETLFKIIDAELDTHA